MSNNIKMETNELLMALKQEIENLKKAVLGLSVQNPLHEKWLPKKVVMDFMDYGDTKMAEFEKTSGIIISKIGRRKFFLKGSIEKYLEKNIQ